MCELKLGKEVEGIETSTEMKANFEGTQKRTELLKIQQVTQNTNLSIKYKEMELKKVEENWRGCNKYRGQAKQANVFIIGVSKGRT